MESPKSPTPTEGRGIEGSESRGTVEAIGEEGDVETGTSLGGKVQESEMVVDGMGEMAEDEGDEQRSEEEEGDEKKSNEEADDEQKSAEEAGEEGKGDEGKDGEGNHEKEKAGNSVETEVVSEERTTVIGSDNENEGEEVDQSEEGQEHNIFLLDDEEIGDERMSRPRTRMSKKAAEILAAKRRKGKDKEAFEAEEEDEDEIPLIRKPRSARVALVEEASAEEARGEEPASTEAEREMDAKNRAAARKQARRERKRKGKQIARPKKKKARRASRTVVIQEPSKLLSKSLIKQPRK